MPPLYTASFPKMPLLDGMTLMTASMGRDSFYQGRDDLMLVLFEKEAAVGGVFTKSTLPAWPVQWSRRQMKKGAGKAKILLVNAGSANALSGSAGKRSVDAVGKACASLGGCASENVFLASTGVIGAPLQEAALLRALKKFSKQGKSKSAKWPAKWKDAAKAIVTTDRFPKGAFAECRLGGRTVRLCAIAKGAGMIAPDMATTLGFVFTDAPLAPSLAQSLLSQAVQESFNALSVDGDMSTNDTIMLFALGGSEKTRPLRSPTDPQILPFKKSLKAVLLNLAQQIAIDGEGARKTLSVHVSGAESFPWAKRVARRIAESIILKAAIAGGDPNWGRVAAAVGMTGAPLSPQRLKISFGGIALYQKGAPVQNPPRAKLDKHMSGRDIRLDVHLGAGSAAATHLGCDLTKEYLKINAARN